MTQEEKEKLRNILYNKKCIADYREEDPFVGIYFDDLIDLFEEYKLSFVDTIEVKDVDLEKEFDKYCKELHAIDIQEEPFTEMHNCAKHFFELGLKTKKGE